MKTLLFYCRSTYEADLQAELIEKFASHGIYAYAKFSKGSAMLSLVLQGFSPNNKTQQARLSEGRLQVGPNFKDLIFARQKLYVLDAVELEESDRVSAIMERLTELPINSYGKVFVEHADSDDGKRIAKFCKKFAVPLRNALRRQGYIPKKDKIDDDRHLPNLHVVFETSASCILAYSVFNDRSDHCLGVHRLKMPSDSPSRSTLKMEEAIHYFFSKQQHSKLFRWGMRAVDLGACPGGWTYQLVKRGLIVEAVDHGQMDEKLMQSGLVEYYAQDGFKYAPKEGNVDWLVCDMIEQPTRVSQLMLEWLLDGKANATIFNLKLPMSKRFKVVDGIMQNLKQTLGDKFGQDFVIAATHLFHNRDEVTVMIIVNSQMQRAYLELDNCKELAH